MIKWVQYTIPTQLLYSLLSTQHLQGTCESNPLWVELFELRITLISHQPEKYGSRRGLGESQIWPTLKSYSTKRTAPFTTKSDVSMGRIPAPACLVYRLRFGVSRALLERMFDLSPGVYLSDAKNRASWGVGLSACSLGQLDVVWGKILVCSSLHAIDRGALTRVQG